MTRLGILIVAVVASASVLDAAGDACHRTKFETQLVKSACARGGQPAAKEAMKQFAKEHKIQSCNHCHAKLAPNYELKPTALDEFHKLGGT